MLLAYSVRFHDSPLIFNTESRYLLIDNFILLSLSFIGFPQDTNKMADTIVNIAVFMVRFISQNRYIIIFTQ